MRHSMATPQFPAVILLLCLVLPVIGVAHPPSGIYRDPCNWRPSLSGSGDHIDRSGIAFKKRIVEVRKAFQEADLIQDLSIKFNPQFLVEIDWPLRPIFTESSFTPDLGAHLYDNQTTLPFTNIRLTGCPSHRHSHSNSNPRSNPRTREGPYVIAMVDPDAPSRADPYWKSFRHFLGYDFYGTTSTHVVRPSKDSDAVKLGNDSDLSDHSSAEGSMLTITLHNETQAASRYLKPIPAIGTGEHRYAILVYNQPPTFKNDIASLTAQNPNWTTTYRGFDIATFSKTVGMGDPVAGFFVWAMSNITGPAA